MNQIRDFLRRMFQTINYNLRHFMTGRYGADKLNIAILMVGLALGLVASFVSHIWISSVFALASYALMIWAIFRCLSRNTYRRYEENRQYLRFLSRLKDRNHRYYRCPNCKQLSRVPKGVGKIVITCPRCKEKFSRKS